MFWFQLQLQGMLAVILLYLPIVYLLGWGFWFLILSWAMFDSYDNDTQYDIGILTFIGSLLGE